MGKYDREKALSDFRVGLITLVALFFVVLAITFAGGDKGLLFKKASRVKALASNVGGLKNGSSVTMSGMTVGRVTNIAFDGHGENNQIEVTMEVRSDIRNRIKSDSIPSIRTQGMLGDRYVDISTGSEQAPILPEGTPLIGKAATDFDETLHETISVLKETEKLLSAVNEQQGTVGQLVYDEKFYTHLLEISNELNDLIKDFKKNPRRYIKFSVF